MRVIITGITGFIGGELAHRLLKEGHEVFGFERYTVGRDLGYADEIKNKIKLISCDITDYFVVRNSIKKINPDIVLHLAALSPVRLSFEHPFEYQITNLFGTINLAEAILDLYGPDKVRMVAASTAEVYGIKKESSLTEDLSLEPSSPYAVSKAAMDMYLRMMHQVYGFNVVILRNSNTFGRKYDNSFFTEYLITEMLEGREIYIGAPDSIRDYMYVDDHINSYLLAMKTPEAKGQTFNIAGGKGYTNREWTLKIAEVLGFSQTKIHFGQYPPEYPSRPIKSDQPFLVLDSSKAKRILGWAQGTPLEEGLRKTISWWKNKIANSKKGAESEQTIKKIKELLRSAEENESSYGFSNQRI
ncbi:SDR family NAD(P)-dependent oxidoreductase [Candidatus Pacearchaeota archaeon]|nr:SDR family NAD(P)-dependent oxidoreductase [Candidatus Pacearchaeota archaeon]